MRCRQPRPGHEFLYLHNHGPVGYHSKTRQWCAACLIKEGLATPGRLETAQARAAAAESEKARRAATTRRAVIDTKVAEHAYFNDLIDLVAVTGSTALLARMRPGPDDNRAAFVRALTLARERAPEVLDQLAATP